jgi:hypothetical protein
VRDLGFQVGGISGFRSVVLGSEALAFDDTGLGVMQHPVEQR